MACDMVTVLKEYKCKTGIAGRNAKKRSSLVKRRMMKAKQVHSINGKMSDIFGITKLFLSN